MEELKPYLVLEVPLLHSKGTRTRGIPPVDRWDGQYHFFSQKSMTKLFWYYHTNVFVSLGYTFGISLKFLETPTVSYLGCFISLDYLNLCLRR